MRIEQHDPMHPGAFIKRVYLEPNNIGSNALARQLKVSTGLRALLKTNYYVLKDTVFDLLDVGGLESLDR